MPRYLCLIGLLLAITGCMSQHPYDGTHTPESDAQALAILRAFAKEHNAKMVQVDAKRPLIPGKQKTRSWGKQNIDSPEPPPGFRKDLPDDKRLAAWMHRNQNHNKTWYIDGVADVDGHWRVSPYPEHLFNPNATGHSTGEQARNWALVYVPRHVDHPQAGRILKGVSYRGRIWWLDWIVGGRGIEYYYGVMRPEGGAGSAFRVAKSRQADGSKP